MTESPSPRLRPLTGGAVRSASSQLVTAVSGALTTLVLARILGPAGAGVYAIALSLLLGLMTLSTLGLQTGISYYVAAGTWSPRQAFAETQWAALVFGVVAIGVGLGLKFVAGPAFRGLDVPLVLLTVSAVPFALSWTYASSVALAIDHYELYAVAQAAQSVVGLVASPVLAAIYGESGAIIGLTASNAVAAVVTFVWSIRVLLRATPPSGHRHEPGLLRRAIGFGLQTHVSNVLSFVNYRLDLFVLNAVASAATVGQYSIAVSVMSAVWLLPRALSTVVIPRVARLRGTRADDDAAYQDMVETKSIRHTTLLVVVSSLALAVLLVALVLLFYGPEFRPSIELGLILLPGTALLGIAGTVAAIIVARGRPDYTLWGALIATPPTILLYLVVVPAFDAVGAAIASTTSYAFVFFLTAYFYRRATRKSVWPVILPTRGEVDDYARLLAAARRSKSIARGP